MSDGIRREAREITSRGEWLSWRHGLMTCSRLPALFGAHKFLSLEQLPADMRGESIKGLTAPMRAGLVMEPAAGAAVNLEHPEWQIRKATTFHLMPDHRFAGTPDFFGTVPGGLLNIQTKVISERTWDSWHGKPDFGYVLQTVSENLITDAAAGILAVLLNTQALPLYLFDVPRHEQAEGRILDAVAGFWRAYDAGTLPEPAPVEELEDMLDDGTTVDLSTDPAIRVLLDEHLRFSSLISEMRKELGHIDHQIKTRIGKARAAYVPGYAVSFATSYRKGYSVAPCEVRTLRIKTINEDMLDE